ncbi:MAG: M20/M25/M40 family metallo-hydrolase [Acidimicrobiales bacterium]
MGKADATDAAGHSDTVPANDNAIARIDGDTLWGVGSADMKGGLACFLEAARTVTDSWVDLTYVFYAREEVAGIHSGLVELIDQRPDLLHADCAILGEPTDGDHRGRLSGRPAVRGHAGWCTGPHRPSLEGRNAVHRLAPILADLAAYESRRPTIDGCTFGETLQAVHAEGGVSGNVVPDRAMLRIHHRYAPDRTDAEAEAFVRDLLAPHLDDGDAVEVIDRSLACAPSLTHPILQRLVEGGSSARRPFEPSWG